MTLLKSIYQILLMSVTQINIRKICREQVLKIDTQVVTLFCNERVVKKSLGENLPMCMLE